MYQKRSPKCLPGFSLIELALVLIVIGILAGAVFKGQDILEAAKIRSVLTDIDRIRTAAALYHDTFGQWPGNDSLAKTRFGDGVNNGRGSGILSTDEAPQFWVHLAKAGHFSGGIPPSSKIGGNFTVEGDPATSKNILVLSGSGKSALLTPRQAALLKSKAEDGGPLSGQIQVIEGKGVTQGQCVQGETLNLQTKGAACILRVELH